MNLAYKHLDSKLRVANLSIGQWIAVLVGAALAVGWGLYLSPLGATLTLVTSVYVVALPVAATLFASLTDVDPWLLVRSGLDWRRQHGRFWPGPGARARGYVVCEDRGSQAGAATPHFDVDLEALWGGH